MDKAPIFERNLRALSLNDPALSREIAGAGGGSRYRFVESRSGEIVPAIIDGEGRSRPLHSTVDPKREAARLVSSFGRDESFLVFFGLGGGFHAAAALKRPETGRLIIVEYGLAGLAELFSALDYAPILGDSRVSLLLDREPAGLEAYILGNYLPALSGGFRLLPLRARTELSPGEFLPAGEAVRRALERLSADYSVQAHFGSRWFENILRNLKRAEEPGPPLPRPRRAAVCAAGPSLDIQIPLLAEDLRKKPAERPFLIATDTSLPALLCAGIEPGAVVSIDCQHISCYHFMGSGTGDGRGKTVSRLPGRLFLDLASPPLLARLSAAPCFFSGGHPLASYISQYWRPLLPVDSSGGNVTYAALSLAERLGAERIDLYGADFSYPLGRTYARGTYIYPFFERRQNRRGPLEALHSGFLYRSPLEKIPGEDSRPGASWYYETAILRRYRELLEEKAASMTSRVRPMPGLGAPIRIRQKPGPGSKPGGQAAFNPGPPRMGADEFLSAYRNRVRALKPLDGKAGFGSGNLRETDPDSRLILTTLLPLAAALRRREPGLRPDETLERTRAYALASIDRVLGNTSA
ncbi:MAG: DUF115 domain-containing protein [Treponema sp.]|jgi:hypothetical protein|nr:DUF115 domain-containing protein [Treponema sp.]